MSKLGESLEKLKQVVSEKKKSEPSSPFGIFVKWGDLTEGDRDILKKDLKGEKGDNLSFDQLTPEQKQEIKGDKGDMFLFSDLSDAEKAEIVDAAKQQLKSDLENSTIQVKELYSQKFKEHAEMIKESMESLKEHLEQFVDARFEKLLDILIEQNEKK